MKFRHTSAQLVYFNVVTALGCVQRRQRANWPSPDYNHLLLWMLRGHDADD